MNETLGLIDLDNQITKTLKDHKLIPKVIFNIKLNFDYLPYLVTKLLKDDYEDFIKSKDIIAVNTLLLSNLKHIISKTILMSGINMVDIDNSITYILSGVRAWLDMEIHKSSLTSIIKTDVLDEEKGVLYECIYSIVNDIAKNMAIYDDKIIYIEGISYCIDYGYILENEYVAYKLYGNEVISIMKF